MNFINKIFNLLLFVLLTLPFSKSFANNELTCTYTLLSNWGSGSQLTFKIKNNTNREIPVWNLKISYPQSYSLTASWSVSTTGSNPIVFSNSPGNVLKPGEWYSHHFGYQVNHGGSSFQVPQIDWCGEPQVNAAGTSQIIPAEGGIINDEEIGSVIFDDEAFITPTNVRVYKSSSDNIKQSFRETTEVFLVDQRAGEEVRINTGVTPPLSEYVEVELVVPEEIVESINSGRVIDVFAGIEQGGTGELPFVVFDNLHYIFNAETNRISFSLPGAAFSKNELTNDQYEALLIIATRFPATTSLSGSMNNFISQVGTGGSMLLKSSATQSSSGVCSATPVSCPVSGGCIVNSPFSPTRHHPSLGYNRPHYGVDLKAALGTSIIAAAAGEVEKSSNHSTFGQTVIIRHADGSATLYAHLNSRVVTVGQSVSQGDPIGTAGKTGTAAGVHLHFEYITQGSVMGSPHRIDPLPCIKNTSSYIEFMDMAYINDPDDDDVFRIWLTDDSGHNTFLEGQTNRGELATFDISFLSPGMYRFCFDPIIAPDKAAYYEVSLFGNAFFYPHGNRWRWGIVASGFGGFCDRFEVRP